MDVIEQLVRSFARRTTQNGVVVLIADGHPSLVAGFKYLGWSDPYIDHLLLPPAQKPEPKHVAPTTKGSNAVV